MEYWFIYQSHVGGFYASREYLGEKILCEECRDYDILIEEGYESDLLYGDAFCSWKEEISRAKRRLRA